MSDLTLTDIKLNTNQDNKWTRASATMNVSKFKLTVLLMRSGKTNALKHIHRALCQTRTLAALEFEQDLLAARPVKWCFKGKHIATVTTDSQICIASEEKVKHIIYLKVPQICVQAWSWHPDKSCHHCASVFLIIHTSHDIHRKKQSILPTPTLWESSFSSAQKLRAPNLHTTVWAVLAQPWA